LPVDTIRLTLSYLDSRSLRNIAYVSKKWNDLFWFSLTQIEICMDRLKVNDELFSTILSKSKYIVRMNLRSCNISDVSVKALVQHKFSGQLRELILSGCTKITDQALEELGPLNLSRLDMYMLFKCSVDGISKLNVTYITNLNIARCGFKDDIMEVLCKMTGLRFLNISGNRMISMKALQQLSQLTSLRHLHMGHCQPVENATLLPLTNLERLSLPKITPLQYIVNEGYSKKFPMLNHIHIDDPVNNPLHLELFKTFTSFSNLEMLRIHSLKSSSLVDTKLSPILQLRYCGICQFETCMDIHISEIDAIILSNKTK